MKEILEKLGLGGWSVLFHAVNLALLIVALYFLLYKPVKKIVENSRKNLEEMKRENIRLREETEAFKEQCDGMKQKALEESAAISGRAAERGAEIIEEAQNKADAILENARKEALTERNRMQHELHDSVGHIAVEIAEKILEREVSEEDNRKLIDESLSEWEND